MYSIEKEICVLQECGFTVVEKTFYEHSNKVSGLLIVKGNQEFYVTRSDEICDLLQGRTAEHARPISNRTLAAMSM